MEGIFENRNKIWTDFTSRMQPRRSRSNWFHTCSLSAQANRSYCMTFHARIDQSLRVRDLQCSFHSGSKVGMPKKCPRKNAQEMPKKCPGCPCVPNRNALEWSYVMMSCVWWCREVKSRQVEDDWIHVLNHIWMSYLNVTFECQIFCKLDAGLLGWHIDRWHTLSIDCAAMSALSNYLVGTVWQVKAEVSEDHWWQAMASHGKPLSWSWSVAFHCWGTDLVAPDPSWRATQRIIP